MKIENMQLEALKQQLKHQEQELQAAYLQLGKKIQEFVEHESDDINRLVDTIIKTKKLIQNLEDNQAKGDGTIL